MIRLLLSLLALVSGLAGPGALAQARLGAAHDTQIGAPAPGPIRAQAAARIIAPAVSDRAPAAVAIGPALPLPVMQTGPRPGVLIGIDRARE